MQSESSLRFDHYVADAAAWVTRLRGDGRFNRLAIAGHSEGSLIGMIAAQRVPVEGVLSLDRAAYPAADILRMLLAPQLAAAPELDAANTRILASLLAGRTDPDVPPALAALYRPSVQPYLMSWFSIRPADQKSPRFGPRSRSSRGRQTSRCLSTRARHSQQRIPAPGSSWCPG